MPVAPWSATHLYRPPPGLVDQFQAFNYNISLNCIHHHHRHHHHHHHHVYIYSVTVTNMDIRALQSSQKRVHDQRIGGGSCRAVLICLDT